MPELPEVESLSKFLSSRIVGLDITRVELASFPSLKTYNPPLDALKGRRVGGLHRHGKFLAIDTVSQEDDEIFMLVFHLSRAGWMRFYEEVKPTRPKPGKGPLALRLGFSDGSGMDVTEASTEKRLQIWVVRSLDEIEHVVTLGPDPLDPNVSAEEIAAILRSSKGQIKRVLTDQRVLAGVGNAYSDEALHQARLSPFKNAEKMTEDESLTLATSLRIVLEDAVKRSADVPVSGLKSEKKSGLQVHGRSGEKCPVCGDTIREVSYSSKSFQYCSTCQTGGKPLADRRMSRLLK